MKKTNEKLLRMIPPGEILSEEFLKPLGISVYRLSKDIGVSRARMNDIVLGRRAITADTALRLGAYFGNSPQFWINLQTHFEFEKLEGTLPKIARCPLIAA
jgi:addiction module HigA family antidote